MVFRIFEKQLDINRLFLFIYLFLCIWGIKSKDESNINIYILTVLAFLYTIFNIIFIKKGMMTCPCRSNFYFAGIFFLIYTYGLIRGILKGNESQYVIRNHSGMLMYFASFIIVNLGINEIMIKKLVKVVGVSLTILTPLMFSLFFVIHYRNIYNVLDLPILNSFSTGIQEMGYTLEYGGIVMLFAVYAYALYEYMYYCKRRYVVIMIVEAVIIGLLSLSSGRILELSMLTFFGVVGLAKSKPIGRNQLILVSMIFIGIIVLPTFFLIIFGADDGGNQIRYIQINYILNNLSLMGHGLGATYSAIGKGYGIETIYLDLFYKLGVFAVPVFAIYVYSYIRCFGLLRKSDGNWIDIVPLVFVGYLWYSFGNPNLFSGGNVIAHILAMEIINLRNRERVLMK